MRKRTWWAWLVVVLGGAFMAAPLMITVINSFNASAVSQFPPAEWSLSWYRAALTDDAFRSGFALSVRVALYSAIIASLAGLGAAYALSRRRVRGSGFLLGMVNAPLSIPKIAVGLAGLVAYTSVVSWLPAPVVSGTTALVLMHAAMALPLVAGILVSSLEALDRRLESAARDLGHPPWRVFGSVTLPLIAPAFLVAFAFAFMISFDDLESSLFMASQAGNTLPVVMFVYLETHLDPTLAALSTLLLAATVALICVGLPISRARARRDGGWQA
ncbi:ABC transporter permease [Amycolatopsis jejuensis]|uniref:ABC transporter permease n=1 Tax=Amycolatopsis jejuensis TaxID=330084 RepID=UPI000527097B|nr:ABC transporter permease subunit [Amycolatopsis jejuensis]